MKAIEVYSRLRKQYPGSKISLNYSNPLELLIAVMLSAQCTDVRVNIVTEELFKKYKTVEDYANCDLDRLKQDIKSTGFYNNKAKNIQNSCKIIIEKHQGKVPNTMEELIALPGVARKTANIVLTVAYNVFKGMAIDTHNKRILYRLGLTKNKNPDKIEQDMIKQLPKESLQDMSHLIITHGRQVCVARIPRCSLCVFKSECPKVGVMKSR